MDSLHHTNRRKFYAYFMKVRLLTSIEYTDMIRENQGFSYNSNCVYLIEKFELLDIFLIGNISAQRII